MIGKREGDTRDGGCLQERARIQIVPLATDGSKVAARWLGFGSTFNLTIVRNICQLAYQLLLHLRDSSAWLDPDLRNCPGFQSRHGT